MNELVWAAVSMISLLMLLVLFFWLYIDFRVDLFRQQMFELRDQMFDDAADGRLDFDDPSYGMMRSAMNGLIRFGHRLNFFQFLAMAATDPEPEDETDDDSFSKRLALNLEKLEGDKKEITLDYLEEMNFLIANHLVLTSPLLIITIALPAIVVVRLKRFVSSFFSPTIKKLDDLAWKHGDDDSYGSRHALRF